MAARATLMSVIVVFGTIGNRFVLWFYGKSKKLTGQVYILTLAVIDLVTCVVMLPQMPQLELDHKEDWPVLYFVLSFQSTQQVVCDFGVQVTYHGARPVHIAVFWPFEHTRERRKPQPHHVEHFGVVVVLILPVRSAVIEIKALSWWYLFGYISLGVVSHLVLAIFYPATANKL